MKYYEKEHFDAYAKIRREGLDQWNDLHDGESGQGYHNFAARDFIESTMPDNGEGLNVFEYGCGTGGAACFLARRGFRVHAMDLVPDAIDVARQRAAERHVQVWFEVGDICAGDGPSETFDYVVDCFCLQSIVTDDDRTAVLSGVARRLKPHGKYVLATAMYDAERSYGQDRYDSETGVVWTPVNGQLDGGKLVGETWYAPIRRHLTASSLRSELERHGLAVIQQSGPSGGEVVCQRRR